VMFDKHKLKEIERRREKWEKEAVQKSLGRLPEKAEFSTSSNIPVSRIYTSTDIADFDYLRDSGFPGEWCLSDDVSGEILDDEAVCRLRHCGTNQSTL
jgi:hypothetical protein